MQKLEKCLKMEMPNMALEKHGFKTKIGLIWGKKKPWRRRGRGREEEEKESSSQDQKGMELGFLYGTTKLEYGSLVLYGYYLVQT